MGFRVSQKLVRFARIRIPSTLLPSTGLGVDIPVVSFETLQRLRNVTAGYEIHQKLT